MTAAHIPSDDTAIRAADDSKTVNAHAALDQAVAWLKRKPSWAALECVQGRALAVFLDRVRVLESLTRPARSVNEMAETITRAGADDLEANACTRGSEASNGAGSAVEAINPAPTPIDANGDVTLPGGWLLRDANRAMARLQEWAKSDALRDPAPIFPGIVSKPEQEVSLGDGANPGGSPRDTRATIEAWEDGPAVGEIALSVASAKLQALRRAVNAAPITPAPNGERKPVPKVPRYSGNTF